MKSETLELLIDQACRRCDAARLRLADAQRQLEKSRAHLATLQQYAREYDERATGRPGELRDVSAQQNLRQFLAKLQQAVRTQLAELDVRERAVAEALDELAQSRRRQQSLETLRQRRLEAQRQVEARREQKDSDEFAQRAHERQAQERLAQDALHTGEAS